jgi:hypothetical protein
VAVRPWASAGRDKHVNQAVASGCVLSREKDGISVSNYPKMR